jgi:hypothetical protein
MDRKRFFLNDRSNRFDKLLVVPRVRANDKRPNKALLLGFLCLGHKRKTIFIAKRVRNTTQGMDPREPYPMVKGIFHVKTHNLGNW